MSGAASRLVDRRTLLVGAAGTLAAAGLQRPARAAGYAASIPAPSATRSIRSWRAGCGRVLRDALRDPSITAPGAILHLRSATLGAWTGVAGLVAWRLMC
jgi:hypothetical protein